MVIYNLGSVNALDASKETPELQGVPAGLKVSTRYFHIYPENLSSKVQLRAVYHHQFTQESPQIIKVKFEQL